MSAAMARYSTRNVPVIPGKFCSNVRLSGADNTDEFAVRLLARDGLVEQDPMQSIVIRHMVDGQTRAEEFPVDSLVELMCGREPSCQLHFDSTEADVVSRRHAKLVVVSRSPLAVNLMDLGSSNGTFVNGQRIQGEIRLSPGDRVQLGIGGPQFQYDVYPPPETRVVLPQEPETRTVIPPTMPHPLPVERVYPPIPPPRHTGAPSPATRKILLLAGLALIAVGLLMAGAWTAFNRLGGKLSTRIYFQKTVMTVAYKAYGNPEAESGKYWFAKVVLQNTGKGSIRNVKVSYQVPDYIAWTTPDEAQEILPGETVVDPFYPKFPSKVTNIRTRTPSQLEIKIDYDDGSGHHTVTEKRDFEFRGVTEFEYTSLPASEIVNWYDMHDNDPLIAAYVTDEDPVVKTFYAKISESCGGVTIISTVKQISDFGKCVYDYMVSLGMTYSGAKGVPENIGDVRSTMQSIRLPREVIYGDSGLCIELSLLWAAVAQAAGIKADIVMIPGHAFPILVAGGHLVPVEATGIGGEAANMPHGKILNFFEANDFAVKELSCAMARPDCPPEFRSPASGVYEILDISDFQSKGIRPPELADKDLTELTKLLDDLRAHHGHRPAVQMVAQTQPAPAPAPAAPARQSGVNVWRDPGGRIAVPFPSSWMVNSQAIATIRQVLPGYAFAASDPAHRAALDVCFFNVPNIQTVFRQYDYALKRFNLSVRIGQLQQSTIGGRTVATTPLTLSGSGSSSTGFIYIAPVGTGFVMVGVTAAQPGAEQYLPVLTSIGAGLRFGN